MRFIDDQFKIYLYFVTKVYIDGKLSKNTQHLFDELQQNPGGICIYLQISQRIAQKIEYFLIIHVIEAACPVRFECIPPDAALRFFAV